MVFSTSVLRSAAKRVPLIKFRKGGPAVMSASGQSQPQQSVSGSAVSASPNKSSPAAAVQKGATIEDWELPPRYRRKQIDPYEAEYINRGGPPL